jgi:Ca2+-binding RTX toxin-like protein
MTTLIGTNGNDILTGGKGDDYLYGEGGSDSLAGAEGYDNLYGGVGNDTLDGGADYDSVGYSSALSGVTVNLALGTATGGEGNDTLISVESVSGSNYDDTLIGNADSNSLYGNGGNDSLAGGEGYDNLYGGAGNDTLDGGADNDSVAYYSAPSGVTVNLGLGTATGGEGNDTLISVESVSGTNYDDTLIGNADSNSLYGNGGNDSLAGGEGYDNLYGGAGDDTLDGGADNDSVAYYSAPSGVTVNLALGTATGGEGNDTLISIESVSGSDHDDTLIGNADSNSLYGNGGNDSLAGGEGDDNLYGGAGNDTLDGGADFDSAEFYSAASGVTVNLALGTATGGEGNDTLISIENVTGGYYDDTLTGDTGNNVLSGSDGNDFLYGGKGDDALYGGKGNDTASYDQSFASYTITTPSGVTVNLALGTATGGEGNDTLISVESVSGTNYDDTLIGNADSNSLYGNGGNDSLAGGEGYDNLYGGAGDDTLDGGADNDSVAYYSAPSGVTVNLALGTATGGEGNDTLISIESVSGSDHDDTLIGNADSNSLYGNGGNDSLAGGEGGDNLYGGAGNDTLDGGADFDSAEFYSAASGVTVNLALGTATGGEGNDTLISVESVSGTNYDDTLIGNADSNSLYGNGGNDSLAGGEGYDNLYGGAGDDTLDGGADNDSVAYYSAPSGVTVNLALGTATGGEGNDTLISIESVSGSDHDDTLIGNADSNSLYGNGGNDSLAGGEGDDNLYGGAGNDTLDGGADFDSAEFYSAASGVTVNLALGTATGGEGNDTLISIENVTGGYYDDTLTGDTGNNVLSGSDGNDFLYGGKGDDALYGGKGNDTASYDQSFASYTITSLYGGKDGSSFLQYHLISNSTLEGSDTIGSDVEFLQFSDGRASLNNGVISFIPGGTTTYSLAANAATGNEGSSAVFTLTTTGVANGTVLSYVLSGTGITAADVTGGALTGNVTVNDNAAIITVALANDLTTEGVETLTASISGTAATASTSIADTSTSPTPATSYTVPGTLSNDFFLPSAGNNYLGGGGNDTYVISPHTLSGAVTAKITDTEGNNVIQLVDGMTISASSFYGNAAQLTLASGAIVQILGASAFRYQVGANAPAGDTATTQTYSQFAATLGASVPPGSTPVSGSADYVVPTGFTQAPALTPAVAGPAFTVPGTPGNDFFIPSAGNNYLGGGGNDTYIISPMTLAGAVTAKITDTEGVLILLCHISKMVEIQAIELHI